MIRYQSGGVLVGNSRRDFLKTSALGLAAVSSRVSAASGVTSESSDTAAAVPNINASQPASEIAIWVTNSKQRHAPAQPIAWHPAPAPPPDTPPGVEPPPADTVRLIPSNKFQDILGFGGCFSDAACYVINQLQKPARDQLLHELFHPSELGLSVNRTCVGSADSAAKLYSYDDGDPDPDLKHFSIDHDREYILPILKQVREINPDVFYFSSPWSPPGWMKWNKSMLGGSMSRQYLASYAQYFLKFLQAYAAAGVPVQAITTQNEIDADQHGQMPACTWSQECETEFITDHLGPLFEKTNTPTKIWILDHNFVYWGRVISQLDDPDFRRGIAGVGVPCGSLGAAQYALEFADGNTHVLPVRQGMEVAQANRIYGASRIQPIATSAQPVLEYIKDVVREHYQVLLWSIRTDQHRLLNLRCNLATRLGNLAIFAINTEERILGRGDGKQNLP